MASVHSIDELCAILHSHVSRFHRVMSNVVILAGVSGFSNGEYLLLFDELKRAQVKNECTGAGARHKHGKSVLLKGLSNLPDDRRRSFSHCACLDEGRDVPVLDVVAFIAPMHSSIERQPPRSPEELDR